MLAAAGCVADAPMSSDPDVVETYEYQFAGHAGCDGARTDYVFTLCFPAAQADLVDPGDAAAAAFANVWLGTCQADHGVLDGVGVDHPGFCAGAPDGTEAPSSCAMTYEPSFVVCGGES